MAKVKILRTNSVTSETTFGTMVYTHDFIVDEKDVQPGDKIIERFEEPEGEAEAPKGKAKK